MINIFTTIGQFIDNILNWLLQPLSNNVNYDWRSELFWSGIVGAILVFIIERIRKPSINIKVIDCPSYFKIFNSKKWHIKITYPNRILNNLLFRYSINNLKVFVKVFNKDLVLQNELQLKPDENPNPVDPDNVTAGLAGINLQKSQSSNFPIFIKPKIEQMDIFNNKHPWILFECWTVFHGLNIELYTLQDGIYFFEINALSDQTAKTTIYKIYLYKNSVRIYNINILEKIRFILKS